MNAQALDGPQPELFETIDDGALLMTNEQREKRYTARQAAALETQARAVLMLVAAGWSTVDIAQQLKLNQRTVNALVMRDVAATAGTRSGAATMFAQLSTRWAGLAVTKEHKAEFKDLVSAASMMQQRANEVAMTGLMGEKEIAPELEANGETPLARVRRLLGVPIPTDGRDPSNEPSEARQTQADVNEQVAPTSATTSATTSERLDGLDEVGGGAEFSAGGQNPRHPDGPGKFAMDLPLESAGDSGKILP